jgi:arylsulfatase
MSGETFDVGIDTGSPVGPYPHRFPCTARIIGVTLEQLDRRPAEVQRAMEDGQARADLSAH